MNADYPVWQRVAYTAKNPRIIQVLTLLKPPKARVTKTGLISKFKHIHEKIQAAILIDIRRIRMKRYLALAARWRIKAGNNADRFSGAVLNSC